MGTNFSNVDQVGEFVENLFTSKPAEVYTKGIEELPDKWQQVIANDGEYKIDYGNIVIFLLKNKINIRQTPRNAIDFPHCFRIVFVLIRKRKTNDTKCIMGFGKTEKFSNCTKI